MFRKTLILACTISRILPLTRCMPNSSPALSKATSAVIAHPSVPLNFSKNMSGSSNIQAVNYEGVLKATKEPDTYIIDVREPHEIRETGNIPNSLNIPLGEVESALKSLNNNDFTKKYGRAKPSQTAKIIFTCRSGKRATTAAEKALQNGFSNSLIYQGSWLDWAKHANTQ